MAKYLYRGSDVDSISDELVDKTIHGGECQIIRGDVRRPAESRTKGETWDGLSEIMAGGYDIETVGITGGVTPVIRQTKRFSDVNNAVVVLDADRLPFQRVMYEYGFMNRVPGTLCHITTMSDYELRDTGGGLIALLSEHPKAANNNQYYFKNDHWGKDRLPATSSQSSFADEAEYIATQRSVDISGAIEGITALWTTEKVEVTVREGTESVPVAQEPEKYIGQAYDILLNRLPRTNVPVYMLLPRKGADRNGFYPAHALQYAWGPDGLVAPEDVPEHFRGRSQ